MSQYLIFFLLFSLTFSFSLSRPVPTQLDQPEVLTSAKIPIPEAKLTGLSIKYFTNDSIVFATNISLHNPFNFKILIPTVTYALKSATETIASGTIPDPGSLTANGDTKLEVPMKVPYSFLIDLLKDIAKDWDIDYVLKVGLIIDLPVVGKFTIPITIKDSIKLPHLN
ncbi:late embryogenesis abundant protein Lea14-A-like [Canna indica]|uniref:Late embryogenesis abundant protein Lea14-A-like n=1 Tax=Canna indica TaxID=4628 RepID=A0AAQ3K1F4_9LILI|nr:late embryogenesis abundant protein Lea14-A-like [Canna indica]